MNANKGKIRGINWERMTVWNNETNPSKMIKIVIDKVPNGPCICINRYDELRFLNGLSYIANEFYDNCESISEPEYVPWTEETAPIPGFVIREKDSEYMHSVTCYNIGVGFYFDGVWVNFNKMFTYYVVVNPDKTESPCGTLK